MLRSSPDVIVGADGRARCFWCGADEDYVAYHDEEWGIPVADDRRLFEKICLEGFQSGLSWLTILRKRNAFRRAFAGFDPRKVARFSAKDVARLLADPEIVRHRGKIESAIGNAGRALDLIDEFGSLAAFVWRFEPDKASRPKRITRAVLTRLGPSREAVAMSKELRSRGFTFVGPTTSYAFMQAMGLVNDHVASCSFRQSVEKARKRRVRTPK